MFAEGLEKRAEFLLAACRGKGHRIATAESCTGGLIASLLTAVAGSSDVFERGFVTYTNLAKQQMLGVDATLFETVGAVSEQVARAMAEGALRHADASLAVSVTGIAGPGGGSEEKPVGLVHMAVARADGITGHQRHQFTGDRASVRLQTVNAAVRMLTDATA